jgi:hypothetical protein
MNIEQLAEQAGFGIDEAPIDQPYVIQPLHGKIDDELRRFAHLVRAQALEEAVGVCEEVHDRYPTDIFPDGQSVDAQSAKMARITANNIAAAIRELAKEKT